MLYIVMVSVENFYWVLYESLLKPSGLDCKYHYPFGSQQNISAFEFSGWNTRLDNHALFYYDQEPIWSQTISQVYDEIAPSWSYRTCKLLANSEHSEIKKSLCKERHMLDWYFFYHGFAALDWFRDARYIDLETPPVNAYLNLNHQVTHHRSYRISLMSRLWDRDLLDRGTNSFHSDVWSVQNELLDANTLMSDREKSLSQRFLDSAPSLPMIADRGEILSTASAHFGHQEYSLWQRSMIHVVNETVFYHPKLHLTEKTFKPIVAGRPFLLTAAPGNLAYLRSYGFQTFDRWIDESYDHEIDPSRRLDLIVDEIQKLCQLSTTQLRELLRDMRPVLEHNKNHFFGKFREIIVDEMLENFDHCCRQWNNGRWRRRVKVPDLSVVRDRLLHL